VAHREQDEDRDGVIDEFVSDERSEEYSRIG
jgi:hypothetical protein